MKTTVVNMNTDEYDVYIGRPSLWGNPFPVEKGRTRIQAITAFRVYYLRNMELKRQIGHLWGKRLGCHCKPLPCHGDVLVEHVVEWAREAYACAFKCDAFCDLQVVEHCRGVAKADLELHVIGLKNQYPCLFRSNVIAGLPRTCKTCGQPKHPHNFRHPYEE